MRSGISQRYFNETVSIKRRTISTDAVGDLSEVYDFIYDNILPARIQPVRYSRYLQYRNENQGREVNVDKEAYIPSDLEFEIKVGDRFITDDGTAYLILWIELYNSANNLIRVGNHQKLYLQLLRAPTT